MRRPLVLTSADNPRLKRIVRLRKQRDRREEGVFIAEGLREVSRALAAGLTLRELFYSPDMLRMNLGALSQHLPDLDRNDPSLFEVTPPLFAKIAYIENPEGLLAVFEQPTWRLTDLPHHPIPGPSADLFLVAAGINKPGNLGAMARTASAAGATALLADADVDAFNPNAIRSSTGAVFTLPTVSAPTPELIRFLKDRQIQIATATPDADRPYTDTDLTQPLAIVIGAEDKGVDETWLRAADVKLTIPMHAGIVDSLNASNAAAVLLFEALRQRRSTPPAR